MKGKISYFNAILLVSVFAGFWLTAGARSVNAQQTQKAPAGSYEGFALEDAIINVAGKIGKSVVSISSEYVTNIPGHRFSFGESPLGDDEFFRRFFGDFFGEIPSRKYKQLGLGSGVIFDSEGYILTNDHVIGNSDKISVGLSDGRQFKGEIKGRDSYADLAVIKIDAHNLPVASLGDSNNLRTGEWVVAIGNPFGFALQNPEPTVTVGVISALHRFIRGGAYQNKEYEDLIQTDAAINPGNSGGPLVNLKGEVVGINVAIFSTSGGFQGIGFATPINSAKRILTNLIQGKKILYGWLGVSAQNLSEDLAKNLGLPDKKGALVNNVLENSPAQKAGIKDGDVIRKFDNKPVNDMRELLSIVGKAEVGRKINVVVFRQNKEMTLEVMVTERPENLEKLVAQQTSTGAWRGLRLEDLTPQNRQRFATDAERGVVVTEVEPESPADDAGLIPGDIIVEINKEPIKNRKDYEGVIKSLKGDVLIKTLRGYVVIKSNT